MAHYLKFKKNINSPNTFVQIWQPSRKKLRCKEREMKMKKQLFHLCIVFTFNQIHSPHNKLHLSFSIIPIAKLSPSFNSAGLSWLYSHSGVLMLHNRQHMLRNQQHMLYNQQHMLCTQQHMLHNQEHRMHCHIIWLIWVVRYLKSK